MSHKKTFGLVKFIVNFEAVNLLYYALNAYRPKMVATWTSSPINYKGNTDKQIEQKNSQISLAALGRNQSTSIFLKKIKIVLQSSYYKRQASFKLFRAHAHNSDNMGDQNMLMMVLYWQENTFFFCLLWWEESPSHHMAHNDRDGESLMPYILSNSL